MNQSQQKSVALMLLKQIAATGSKGEGEDTLAFIKAIVPAMEALEYREFMEMCAAIGERQEP